MGIFMSVMEDWLVSLHAELEEKGITIPERLNEDELHIFHDASGGDFAKFLSSVEKTIQWRRKYTMLSQQELDDWGNLVFWHGSDVMQRPTLVIRIGLAGSTLDSDDQAKFARAVVTFRVEYGVVNLVHPENPQITVLLDCSRLSPFEFPLQTFKSCVALLQDHYPNRLGCLLVVRVPSNAKVMTQTLYQDLRPGTMRKLIFVEAFDYRRVLSSYFKDMPDFPTTGEEAIGGLDIGSHTELINIGNPGEFTMIELSETVKENKPIHANAVNANDDGLVYFAYAINQPESRN
ncbi:uncharacterized protein LOC111912212 [Lactuca sativa]|uniref:CRAL-TRIO domain-containing protein n=1 Tax=Lactuca sativa TaxID=4236 RepID=A0A9R1XMD3_LACSA|nr:uncharacterized protein LOC111912212 [Lactuca sativa]KAJ0220225.1 hypothetical protein LSAT_V11C200093380 [Lactuca sativa]